MLCRHQWPPVYFTIDEYRKEYKCKKCGRHRVVYVSDKPEYIHILPTDYYQQNEQKDDEA